MDNVKGIIFKAIGSLIGLGVAGAATKFMNDKWNPELEEAKAQDRAVLLAALRQPFATTEEEAAKSNDNIIDTTATEQEASE